MKFTFEETTVTFYKNVLPPQYIPLWEVDFIASSFDEIPKEVIQKLSEEDINLIEWFFEDL